MTENGCLEMLAELECSETFKHAEVLTDSFIQTHTDFASVSGFFFGLPLPSKCTFDQLDHYVERHTKFKSWIELLCAAKDVHNQTTSN